MTPESDQKPSGLRVEFFDRDGRPLRTQVLALGAAAGEARTELAIAPDGKHMVIGRGSRVHFLAKDGRLLGEWHRPNENQALARPTFSVDSKQVACRLLVQDEHEKARTAAIVFFSPQGEEAFRVPVPPVEPVGPAAGSAAAPDAPMPPGK